jgi:hypothetical protein
LKLHSIFIQDQMAVLDFKLKGAQEDVPALRRRTCDFGDLGTASG